MSFQAMTESEDLSPAVYAELLKKLESDQNSWKSWSDIESFQTRLFKRRMEIAARDVRSITTHGDGNCGAIIEMLMDALREAGAYKDKEPDNRYKKRKIPPGMRKRVFERDAYRCKHCGTHKDLCIDHIYPEFLGGTSTYENLQVLCAPCNGKKGKSIPGGCSNV